jgi:tetratricopeptide (TPR) repeat protein
LPHHHVTDREVSLFISGRLEGLDFQSFVRQALHPCLECRRKLGHYAPVLDDAEPPPPEALMEVSAEYDAVLDRVFSGLERHVALATQEKAVTARLIQERRDLPDDAVTIEDPHAVEEHYGAWIEAHLTLSFELRYRDPYKMMIVALGASLAAKKLGRRESDRARYSPAQITDLRARTLIELANAQRLNHLYHDANNALAEAAGLLEDGEGDPLTAGRLLDVQASLLMDERKLDEALRHLGRLHRHYLGFGETHLAGRALISKGIALHRNGRPKEAVEALRKGLAALLPERDPKLFATSQQALVHALVDAEEFSEAGTLFMKSGLRQVFADDPLNLLKLNVVEGKIFAGLGKLRRAEKAFSEVKEELLLRDRSYLAAMLNLELAKVLLRQNRAEEVEPLAQEALEIFRRLNVDREAVRAMSYLHDASQQRQLTLEIVQRVAVFLDRLERQPGLRFAL